MDATRIRRPAARHGVASRPRWARLGPGREWPDTNARATWMTRTEHEEWRLQRERPTQKRAWPTGPPATTIPHAADVRPPPGPSALLLRRDAPKKRGVAVRRRPEAPRVPALDLSCTIYQQDKTSPAANLSKLRGSLREVKQM